MEKIVGILCLRGCDSFSHRFSLQRSLLEVMARGLFPILSDVPQNREWTSKRDGNGAWSRLTARKNSAKCCVRPSKIQTLRAVTNFNRNQILERADSSRTMAQFAVALRRIAKLPEPSPVCT